MSRLRFAALVLSVAMATAGCGALDGTGSPVPLPATSTTAESFAGPTSGPAESPTSTQNSEAPQSESASASNPSTSPPPSEPESPLETYSTSAATSLWVVVNKSHQIDPLYYVPPGLVTLNGYQIASRIKTPLENLLTASRNAGAPLQIVSGFRSYDYQRSVYARRVAASSVAEADRYVARPGYSEHQTGLTVDVGTLGGDTCVVEACFGDTVGGKWLKAHAGDFGFVIRYTAENSKLTGYNPEPWHIRYVGPELVKALKESGETSLEGYFNITGGDYTG